MDAFASDVFAGNPAAVIKRDDWLSDSVMQKIAMENNLSETAFVVANGDAFDLRWFTPTVEIDFCGHATIATSHILLTEYGLEPPFHFNTKVGRLSVAVDSDQYVLDAPIAPAVVVPVTPDMHAAFQNCIIEAFTAGQNLYLVLDGAEAVSEYHPDMAKIIPLSNHGVGITARGRDGFDCVSRFFVPAEGIDEDPVTGSAHAAIGPYWMDVLGKRKLRAYQASSRGGVLDLTRMSDDRIFIAGFAVTYLRGHITVPNI